MVVVDMSLRGLFCFVPFEFEFFIWGLCFVLCFPDLKCLLLSDVGSILNCLHLLFRSFYCSYGK